MSTPAQRAQATDGSVVSRFMINPLIPIDKEFLRELQRIAVQDPQALSVWAENYESRPEEEAVYFMEKEWCTLPNMPTPHRVDLYTIQRGLAKVFDIQYKVSIAFRQTVLRALFEQQARPSVLSMQPRMVSHIIQLALFDQGVY